MPVGDARRSTERMRKISGKYCVVAITVTATTEYNQRISIQTITKLTKSLTTAAPPAHLTTITTTSNFVSIVQ